MYSEIVNQSVSPSVEEKQTNFSVVVPERVVIFDECGDSLWDEVLEQEYPTLKYADIIL
ncbi:MAG: hypothetical protein JST75_20255 [Bacteroidetes bacterium]|nr:hypothetical protein [Bacteroidota bacterium]